MMRRWLGPGDVACNVSTAAAVDAAPSRLSRRAVLGAALCGTGAARALAAVGGASFASGAPAAVTTATYSGVSFWSIYRDGALIARATRVSGGVAGLRPMYSTSSGELSTVAEVAPLELTVNAGESRDLLTWLQQAWSGQTGLERTVEAVAISMDGRELYRQRGDRQMPVGVATSEFDVNAAERFDVTVAMAGPAAIQSAPAAGSVITGLTQRRKLLLRNAFRFYLQGFEAMSTATQRITSIEARNVGGRWQFPAFSVTARLPEAGILFPWFGDALAGKAAPRAAVLQCFDSLGGAALSFNFASVTPLSVSRPDDAGRVTVALQPRGLQIDTKGLAA